MSEATVIEDLQARVRLLEKRLTDLEDFVNTNLLGGTP